MLSNGVRAPSTKVQHMAPSKVRAAVSVRRMARIVGHRACVAPAATSSATDVEILRHILPEGLGLEVLRQKAWEGGSSRPILLFVHGSYHAAWAFKEKFLPYFSSAGYDCYAISLRGQGNSDPIQGVVAGTIDTHAADIADFIAGLPSPPVVISHSFSGLILQKYILDTKGASGRGREGKYPPLSGAAFLCSVPPSGNKQLVGRVFLKNPIKSLSITWGLIAKTFTTNLQACRDLYFSQDLPLQELKKYQGLMAQCSFIRLVDLQNVNSIVPLPPAPPNSPPTFVLGADQDVLVDPPAVEELAKYYNTQHVIIPNMAHDCMLDTRWESAASSIRSWLDRLPGVDA